MPRLTYHFLIVVGALFCFSPAHSQGTEPTAETEFERLYQEAYACFSKEEYVCAAYQFSKLESMGIWIEDEAAGNEILKHHATALMMAYKVQLVDWPTVPPDEATFLAMKKTGLPILNKGADLELVTELLERAQFDYSYLNILNTADRIEYYGVCSERALELLPGLVRMERDTEKKLDRSDYGNDVVEAATIEVSRLQEKQRKCATVGVP